MEIHRVILKESRNPILQMITFLKFLREKFSPILNAIKPRTILDRSADDSINTPSVTFRTQGPRTMPRMMYEVIAGILRYLTIFSDTSAHASMIPILRIVFTELCSFP